MTRVRECTIDDLDFLTEKAIAFNNKHYYLPLNLDKLERYLVSLITEDVGVILRSDEGAICGVFIEDPLRDWNILLETAWYSEGRDGLYLLSEFEKRGREAGVDEIRMTTLYTAPTAKWILRRRGYVNIETSHALKL